MSTFWIDRFVSQMKGGVCMVQSPPSINNIESVFNAAKAFLVYKKSKPYKKFIFIHDDREVLEKIPEKIPDLDGIFKTPKPLKKYIGLPYNRVPAPFSNNTWAQHFSRMTENIMGALGMYTEFFNISEIYREGKFDEYILKILENTKSKIPFDPLCKSCYHYAKAVSFSLEHMEIKYKCKCGYEGVSNFRDGKLHKDYETAVLWCLFETSFQPSDNNEKNAINICKKLFKTEPPLIKVHKPLLINGKKPSAKDVHITIEILRIIEPEVLLYYYSKSAYTSRNIDFIRINSIVDEFDRAERVYFNLEKQKNKRVVALMKKGYEISMKEIPKKMPLRIPYNEAVLISKIATHKRMDMALKCLKSLGLVKGKLSKTDIEYIKRRLTLANYWSEKYSPFNINTNVKNIFLKENQKIAIKEFVNQLESDKNLNIEKSIKIISNELGISESSFYSGIYSILILEKNGPHLSSLIESIGSKEVVRILKKI